MFKPARIKFALAAVAALLCVCAPASLAQCNVGTVTATVTDPNGLPYSYGTISAVLQPATTQPLCGGSVIGGFVQGSLDVNGTVTLNLAANASIIPSGTKWVFTVNGNSGLQAPVGLGGQAFTSSGITITTGTQSLSTTLSALAPALTRTIGSGGGAGNPASPAFAMQVANSSVNAFATSQNSLGVLGVDATTGATRLNVPYSLQVCGPRPWLDVTCYGADPTGATDSTAAFTAAVTASCASTVTAGTVHVPQGTYSLTQPQTGSSAVDPVIAIPSGCQGYGKGFFMYSDGSGFGDSQQFSMPPSAKLIVNTIGGNPSMGPIITIGATQDTTALEGLFFAGYNQAIQINATSNVVMRKISTSTHNTGQGLQHGSAFVADNVGLAMYNSFWIWCDYCNLQGTSGVTTLPVALMAGIDGSNRGIVGDVYFDNGIWSGGGIEYDQRTSNPAAAAGGLHFANITQENCGAQPIYQMDSEGVSNYLQKLELANIDQSDCGQLSLAAVVLNANSTYQDVSLFNVNTASAVPAILLAGGSLYGCNIWGSSSVNREVVNSSGQIVQGCKTDNAYGHDYVSGSVDTGVGSVALYTNMNYRQGNPFGSNYTATPIRMTNNGDRYATLAISPIGGMLFGPTGTQSGYDTEIYRPSNSAIALRVAAAQAPAAPTIALVAGGSLTVGTPLFYTVASTTVASTCLQANETGPSNEVTQTPAGGNQTLTLNWTNPGQPAIVGYCVWKGTSGSLENTFYYISGAGTTTFTDDGTNSGTSGTQPLSNSLFSTMLQANRLGAAISGQLNQGAANTFAGTVALAAGTATVTFPTAYNSAPSCTANDQAAATAIRVQTSVSAVTLTAPTSVTDSVFYHCVGNPN